MPVKCPLGYREQNQGFSNRTTFSDTCEICPPGFYGARDDREACDSCRAGVVCKEGAITDHPLGNDSSIHGYNNTK